MEEKEKKQINLPQNWSLVKLGDLVINPKSDFVDGPFGSNLKRDEYKDHGIPVFKIQNIKAGYFLDKKIDYVTEEKAEELSRHTFQLGDLIVTKLGDPLGLCCQVPTKYPFGVIVADLIRIRPSKIIVLNDFLMYLINSEIVQNQFKEFTKGTTRPRVNLTIVREIDVPLPPLAEQQRIVSKIEELFSELDAGIRNLRTAEQQLKIYRQAVLQWAFEGKLTNANVNKSKLPNGWKITKLEKISKSISDGDHQAPPKSDSGVPFITISNINKVTNTIDFSDTFFVSQEYYEDLKENRKPMRGDILYTVTGSFGIPVLVNYQKDFCFQRHIGLIRPLDSTNQKWLYYLLQSPLLFHQAEKTATGTAQKTVALKSLRNFEIPLCSPDEQQRIVEEIESRLSVCDNIEETINQSLKQAESLRQSLLKQAFEGKLVSQDSKDAPASVLLERIKQERKAFILEQEQLKQQIPKKNKSKTMAEELKSILQLLKEKGEPIDINSLWQSSEHKENIDAFYADVKKLINESKIEETSRDGKKTFLVLAASK